METIIRLLLFGCGVFGVGLGLLHFTFPRRFGYRAALAPGDQPHGEFALGPYRRRLVLNDLFGIVMVMNHTVSYTIFVSGLFDLAAPWWLGTPGGALAALAAAGFWFTRALAQLYVGRTRNNWLVLIFFAAIGVAQLAAAGT